MKIFSLLILLCITTCSFAAVTVTVTCPSVNNILKMGNTGSTALLYGTPWSIKFDKASANVSQDYPNLTPQAVAFETTANNHTRITCAYSSSNNNKLIFVAKVAASDCSRQNDSTVICRVE